MSNRNNYPDFCNGFRVYDSTPPPMKRRQKYPFADIPIGGCLEVDSNTWPAETKLNERGVSNVANSAYSWAKKHGYIFRTENKPCGNVIIYNIGER